VQGLIETLKAKGKGGSGIPCAYISKPHESVGQSYGHLPGDMDEKTAKEFQSYFQYFDRFGQPFLADVLRGKKQQGEKPIPPMLEVLVFEYLRGRDIQEGWVILDESQNVSRKDMATFISRMGDNAKVILLGDTTPTQIDKKGNTTENNGLTFAKETFADKKYSGSIQMQSIDHIIRGKRVRDLYMSLKTG
jgi:predicted ribonuclease YlaK